MTKEQKRKEMMNLMEDRDEIVQALKRTKEVGIIPEYDVRGLGCFYLHVDGLEKEIKSSITSVTIKILESKLRSIRAKIGKIKI